MQVKNKRSYAVEIAATGQTVEPGATVEVDDELGEALTAQVDAWEKVRASKKAVTATDEESS